MRFLKQKSLDEHYILWYVKTTSQDMCGVLFDKMATTDAPLWANMPSSYSKYGIAVTLGLQRCLSEACPLTLDLGSRFTITSLTQVMV